MIAWLMLVVMVLGWAVLVVAIIFYPWLFLRILAFEYYDRLQDRLLTATLWVFVLWTIYSTAYSYLVGAESLVGRL